MWAALFIYCGGSLYNSCSATAAILGILGFKTEATDKVIYALKQPLSHPSDLNYNHLKVSVHTIQA